MKIDPALLADYRRQEAEQQRHLTDLTTPRTRTDPTWRAEVAALVTPQNDTQRIALHYATVVGVIPITVFATDGQRIPNTGTTGAVAIPEPTTMAALIAAMDNTHQLGIRLPANIIGLDIDTYDIHTTGGIVHKRGGTRITDLETTLGFLPPTIWSTRHTPISDAPQHRTGIRLYQINERTLTYHARRGHPWLTFRDIPPHVETISFAFRYAAVAPTIADGLTYTWHAANGTQLDPLDLPSIDTLPALPDTWAAHLIKDPRLQRHRTLRAPGEPSGGGTTYAERADAADQWCRNHIHAWTAEPDPYLNDLANRYIHTLTSGPASRHLTALAGTHALLRAATGYTDLPVPVSGHPPPARRDHSAARCRGSRPPDTGTFFHVTIRQQKIVRTRAIQAHTNHRRPPATTGNPSNTKQQPNNTNDTPRNDKCRRQTPTNTRSQPVFLELLEPPLNPSRAF